VRESELERLFRDFSVRDILLKPHGYAFVVRFAYYFLYARLPGDDARFLRLRVCPCSQETQSHSKLLPLSLNNAFPCAV
jgi:hypothetical protein